jgi:hypothetical protein
VAWIDTLTALFPSMSSSSSLSVAYYAVYSAISNLSVVSLLSSTTLGLGNHIIGFVLGSTLSAISLGSSSSVFLTVYNSIYDPTADAFQFQVVTGLDIPEPNGIVVVVTGVAALATLLRRWSLRRRNG